MGSTQGRHIISSHFYAVMFGANISSYVFGFH